MKKIFIFFLLLLILSVFTTVYAEETAPVVLRFGHTPDYAPFAYLSGDGTSEGIDVEMMAEIARRMGGRLETVTITRDKMFDALYSGQVDVIGGALSVNDERAGIIDFSNIYYASDSLFICLNAYYKPDQVTLYNFYQAKIGVEKGSNFEQWINNNLVKGNYVRSSDVYAYDTLTDAMKALDIAAVNLVIMDREPYRTLYEPTGKYKIFYDNVQKEEYAYGVRKDDPIRQLLNIYMQDMFNEGIAQNIADHYFNMDFSLNQLGRVSVVQTGQGTENADLTIQKPTEVPTALLLKFPPAPACTNDLGNIVDVSESTAPVAPGERFRRKWQFQNTGTCTWTKDYRFDLASGINMGTNGFAFPGEVVPGGTFELYVDLVAPATPGTYNAAFQMRSPQGQLFGQQALVNLSVGGTDAPQANPANQPAPENSLTQMIPQISEFYASSNQGYPGDAVTVYWSVSDCNGVQIFVDGAEVENTDKLNGSAVVYGTLQSVGWHEIELEAQSATGTAYASIWYETMGE